MSFTVYYSDPAVTARSGFGKVARLPCILDSRPGYHRVASQYLIDRGLGVWDPKTRGQGFRVLAPSDQTILTYACCLANALEWAETREANLTTCDYVEDIHGRYQKEMLAGEWSRDGRPLKPATINLRVQQVCDYLTWMADKGYRRPFDVPYDVRKLSFSALRNSGSRRANEVLVRKGKVRQECRHLRMPTDEEVKLWLNRVYDKFGYTKGLMCELVLHTAIRREEVGCWRVDTLPEELAQWHISNPDAPAKARRVLLTIKFGTKGTDYGYDHNDKIGPAGSIWIPLYLAERLHEYRMKRRNPALKQWVRAASTVAEQRKRAREAVHLFRDEKTGARITSKQFYNAWTGVALPFDSWSPHSGRHWWACSTLWYEMKKHERLLDLGIGTAAQLIQTTALGIIDLIIKPQLRHTTRSTTMIYLTWLQNMLGIVLPLQHEAEFNDLEVPERNNE